MITTTNKVPSSEFDYPMLLININTNATAIAFNTHQIVIISGDEMGNTTGGGGAWVPHLGSVTLKNRSKESVDRQQMNKQRAEWKREQYKTDLARREAELDAARRDAVLEYQNTERALSTHN